MNGYDEIEINKKKDDNDIPYRNRSYGSGSPKIIGHLELCDDKWLQVFETNKKSCNI